MLTYLLQSCFCAILFYLVYVLFFKTHTNHKFNRFYILSSILLSLLIPWIEITIGTETVIQSTSNNNSVVSLGAVVPSKLTLTNILAPLYFSGLGISLIIFFNKLIKLVNIIFEGEKRIINGHQVVITKAEIGICSFWNHIIIPISQVNEISHFELTHERSHLNQFHSLDIILAWLFQSFFWFNPVAYLFKVRLMEVHEFLADQDAINEIGKPKYQEYILNVISQKLQPQLVHNFKSIIKTRLIMMNSKSKPNKWSYLAVIATFTFSVISFSCQAQKITKTMKAEPLEESWQIETLVDTIIVIDYDTFEETVSIMTTDLQYRLDTMIILDAETLVENVVVQKIYSDKSKKFLEERAKN